MGVPKFIWKNYGGPNFFFGKAIFIALFFGKMMGFPIFSQEVGDTKRFGDRLWGPKCFCEKIWGSENVSRILQISSDRVPSILNDPVLE